MTTEEDAESPTASMTVDRKESTVLRSSSPTALMTIGPVEPLWASRSSESLAIPRAFALARVKTDLANDMRTWVPDDAETGFFIPDTSMRRERRHRMWRRKKLPVAESLLCAGFRADGALRVRRTGATGSGACLVLAIPRPAQAWLTCSPVPPHAEVMETVTSTQLIRLISSMPPVLTGMARAPRPHQDLAVAQIDQSTSQPRSLTVLVPRRLDQPLSGSAALLIVCISAANALAPAGSSNGSLRCASGSTSSSRAAAASSVISSTSAR